MGRTQSVGSHDGLPAAPPSLGYFPGNLSKVSCGCIQFFIFRQRRTKTVKKVKIKRVKGMTVSQEKTLKQFQMSLKKKRIASRQQRMKRQRLAKRRFFRPIFYSYFKITVNSSF